MRTLKFRIWDKESRNMYYPELIFDNNRMAMDINGYKFFKDAQSQEMRQYCEDAFIYMQWTGLLDNNGKEIYERDIIGYDGERCRLCNNLLHNNHELHIVEWDDINCCFEAVNYKNRLSPSFWEDVVIVGNIYENIELIRRVK